MFGETAGTSPSRSATQIGSQSFNLSEDLFSKRGAPQVISDGKRFLKLKLIIESI